MNLKLDLSKFKKISGDAKSTKMRHEDGHEMIIAHKALSPKMRSQIAAIPAHDNVKQSNPKLEESKKQPPEAKRMAKGGSVEPTPSPSPTPEPSDELPAVDQGMPDSSSDADKPIAQQIRYPKYYAEGDMVEPEAKPIDYYINGEMPEAPAAQRAPASMDPVAAPDAATPQPMAAAPSPQQPAMPEPAPKVAQDAQASSTLGKSLDDESNAMTQGFEEKLKGIQGEAQQQGDLATQQAGTYQKEAQQQQQSWDALQQQHQKINGLIDSTIQDYKDGHIDPQHFVDNMSTGKKITTAIGLILGGAQAGDFLQKQIDRDIDAQKFNIDKKHNLLGVLSKHLGDVNDAAIVSKNILAGVTADNLATQASKMQPGILQQQALQKAAELKMAYAPQLQQMTLKRAAAAAGAHDDPAKMIRFLRVTDPAMAKEMEQHYVPQVGMALVTVPQEVRGTLVAKQQLGNMARDFYTWAQKHSGSLDPRVANEGKTKAAELQSLYRNSINGGVFKKGEQEFIDQIVDSDPTKFFNNLRVLPKIKEVIHSNDQQLNTLKEGYGLPPSQTSTLPSQPETATRNGITYRKVPGGWAPVKK